MPTSPDARRETRRILLERARALAREPGDAQPDAAALDVVVFRLAHERYAIETAYVSEVHPLDDLTPLPGTPAFVAGIVNIRGRILAVVDLKKFFDLPESGITDAHQLVLVRAGDVAFGILADVVDGVQSIPADALQASLPTLAGVREDYLQGVTAERLVVLDAARIVADPRLIVHDEVDT